MKRKGPSNEEKEGWDLAVGEGAVGVDVGVVAHHAPRQCHIVLRFGSRRYSKQSGTNPTLFYYFRDQQMRKALYQERQGLVNLYRGTSLKRNSAPLGPYSRTMPRALWRSWGGGGCFL